MGIDLFNLKVPVQESSNWCWAATTLGVADYYALKSHKKKTGLRQCDIVNRRLECKDCCVKNPDDLPAKCDVQSGLTLPLFEAGHHSVTYANQLDLKTIISEVEAGRPVCVRVVWEQGFGEGHFVVIVGVILDEDGMYSDVVVEDSFHGRSIQTFETFRQYYRVPAETAVGEDVQEGLWTHSYFTEEAEVTRAKSEAAA